jgi:hypothetical protein
VEQFGEPYDDLNPEVVEKLETFKKFELVLGLFWSLATLYFVFSLFPPLSRKLQQWEARLKRPSSNRAPLTWLQRLVFIPLPALMSAALLAQGTNHTLEQWTGLRPATQSSLMLLLPALFLWCASWNNTGRSGRLTGTSGGGVEVFPGNSMP